MMEYFDIIIKDEVRALATLEGENNSNISKKQKNKAEFEICSDEEIAKIKCEFFW